MNEVKTVEVISPVERIVQAIGTGADLDKLEKLLQLQKDWDAEQAKKAFHIAMADFKSVPISVTKDKENKQYNSTYTTLGNLVNTVNPVLSKNRLSARWDIEQSDKIKVTCIITHALGHQEKTSASAPADTSGAKNPIQQIKSTITYLKGVTFESICGLASSDANVDDDGNASGTEYINEWQSGDLEKMLKDRDLKEEPLLKYLGIKSLREMPLKDYKKAESAIKAAKKEGVK